MKRTISLLLSVLLTTIFMVGCNTDSTKKAQDSEGDSPQLTSAEGDTGNNDTEKKSYRIGVVQLVEHAALDKAYKGFVDSLTQYGEENNIQFEFDLKNAQNDQSNANTIASKFVNDKVDLIFAIATPAAQSAANAAAETDIPVLFTAVTDPVDARLVESVEAPGGKVTGTSDLTPVAKQIELAKQLIPDLKSIGVLYASNESNSKVQLALAQEAAEAQGLTVIPASVSNTNEVQSVVQNVLAGKVQAIYAPTDNTIANAMPTVSAIAIEYNIPVITGEEGTVVTGGLATIGINYYDLGTKTADLALDILIDGKKPSEIPIAYVDSYAYSYNSETLAALGLEGQFDAEFLEQAQDVTQETTEK